MRWTRCVPRRAGAAGGRYYAAMHAVASRRLGAAAAAAKTAHGDVSSPRRGGGARDEEKGDEERQERNGRKLLVLDLNGLLVHRTKRRKPAEGGAWKSNLRGFLTSTNNVYTRPYVSSFLAWCFSCFDVAVWTSCREQNMEPILEKLLTSAQRELLVFAWHNAHCGFDSEAQYKRLKDLRIVWRCHATYDRTNTLLIDDSPNKARQTPFNAIHPATFSPHSMRAKRVDDVLRRKGRLVRFLTRVKDADDVSALLRRARGANAGGVLSFEAASAPMRDAAATSPQQAAKRRSGSSGKDSVEKKTKRREPRESTQREDARTNTKSRRRGRIKRGGGRSRKRGDGRQVETATATT